MSENETELCHGRPGDVRIVAFLDSIAEAVRPAAIVGSGAVFSSQQIMSAIAAMPPLQKINIETRAVHAAAFWTPECSIVALREDVGRQCARQACRCARARGYNATDGAVLLTSRISVEMV